MPVDYRRRIGPESAPSFPRETDVVVARIG